MPPQTHAGFEAGQNILGAVIGFGGIGSANASIGGRFEHGIRNLPDLGNGLLSLAVDADFYHYSDPLFPGASWTYIPLGGTINYHFRLDDRRIDPFIGVGLGYSVASVSGGGSTYTASSSLYAITRLGGRYFFTPNAAIQADAGAGAAALNVGLAWKM